MAASIYGRPTTGNLPGGGGGGASSLFAGYGFPTPEELVAAQLDPQYTELEGRRQRQRALEQVTRQAILQSGQELLASLGEAGRAVMPTYDAQIAATTGAANQQAQALAGANPNPQLQADLQAIGAPAEQQAAAAQALQATYTGGADVLRHLAGALPASRLAVDRNANVAREIGGQRQSALDTSRMHDQALWSQFAGEQAYEDQRRAITSQAPGLRAAAEQADFERSLALRQMTNQERAAAVNQFIAEREYGTKLQGQQFNQAATTERLMQGRTRITSQQLQADRQWKATLARLGIQERGLQLRASQLEAQARNAKRRGKTPSASQLQEMADLSYFGEQPKEDAYGNVTGGVKAVDYQTALFGMMNQGVPLATAQRYLNQFYRRGERGRPRVPFQQRRKGRR